jgi:signal peptidase
MVGRQALVRGIEIFVLLLVIVLVAGQLVGQPILLSYVETGSMAPQLQPGDGFIAIPIWAAGPVEESDVIVFDAEELHGGGLVTHRVVEVTDRGIITRGDANPFTDQDGREPPVQRPQVVAKALQVGGQVVAIPALGAGVIAIGDVLAGVQQQVSGVQQQLAALFQTRSLLGTQGLAYILFGLGISAYLLSFLTGQGGSRGRDRQAGRDIKTMNVTLIIGGLTIFLVLVMSLSMVLAGGTQTFEVISSDSDAPGYRVIGKDTTETLTYSVPSNGVMPVMVFLESDDDRVNITKKELYVPSNGHINTTVALTAPPETGRYLLYLNEHRYLAVLPQGTIRALYHMHPWLPIIVIDALFGIGFAGLSFALVGWGKIRIRPGRGLSVPERLRRFLR